MRSTLLPVLLLMFPSMLAAQRMGPSHFAGTPVFRGAHRGGFAGSYYPLGFFGDYLSEPGYAPSSQPVIVLQTPRPAPAAEPAPPPSQPLMIELQGDHYVQISGDQTAPGQIVNPSQGISRASGPTTTTGSPNPIPTAILIFRDGHREEVTGYTITDGRLYITSNYLTTGVWIQKIELAALNLPETIAANNISGRKFQIPSSANEVIVGP